jgi:hypothetical protein
MRRLLIVGVVLAVMGACSQAGGPTPQIIYVTPEPEATEALATPGCAGVACLDRGTPMPTAVPAAGPTARPTAKPTARPTLAPTPEPPTEGYRGTLAYACRGGPVPGAAEYGGTVHPLVVLDRTMRINISLSINAKWRLNEWTGPIQLVLCMDEPIEVKVGSCGTYTRKSDGQKGRIDRYKTTQKVRVIVAATGKQTGYKTFAGNIPPCSTSLSLSISGPPPWNYYGDDPDDEAIDAYAVSVSTKE